jgi:exosome complex component RRP45
MNKEASLSIAERDFILNALREDVRLDGRHADQLRPLTVTFGEEYGHVKVQLGKTRWVLSNRFGVVSEKADLSVVSLCAYPQK